MGCDHWAPAPLRQRDAGALSDRSEVILHAKLHVAGTDAVAQARDLAEVDRAERTGGVAEHRRIGEVSRFEAKLEATRFEQIFRYEPITFDPACVASVRAAALRFGYSHRDIVSGAGHDACYLSKVAPTAMVFVPCVGGISHNEIEDATPEWIEAGANVLLHAMLGRAGR